MAFLKGHYQLVLLTAVIITLWATPLVLPLKLLVVFLHELSHGLAALVTGGEMLRLEVSVLEGGHVLTRGGNRFVILSAGYLGSLAFGVLLFLLALRTRVDRAALALLGITLVLTTVLYVRSVFAAGFLLGTGAVLIAGARWLPRAGCDLVLRVIGLTSMLYAPYDIFSDTIARSYLQSDARLLAEQVGGPTVFWGGLWLLISLTVIVLSLRHGLGADSNLRWRGQQSESKRHQG